MIETNTWPAASPPVANVTVVAPAQAVVDTGFGFASRMALASIVSMMPWLWAAFHASAARSSYAARNVACVSAGWSASVCSSSALNAAGVGAMVRIEGVRLVSSGRLAQAAARSTSKSRPAPPIRCK